MRDSPDDVFSQAYYAEQSSKTTEVLLSAVDQMRGWLQELQQAHKADLFKRDDLIYDMIRWVPDPDNVHHNDTDRVRNLERRLDAWRACTDPMPPTLPTPPRPYDPPAFRKRIEAAFDRGAQLATADEALQIARAERDRLRTLLTRIYREAYDASAHAKATVQTLWQEVASVVEQ